MEITTREFRLPFPFGTGGEQYLEARDYLECYRSNSCSLTLRMAGNRTLDDYSGLGEEGTWDKFLDLVLGKSVPQDELWENILNLNPRAERKGEVLGVTDAAALTSEGKIYLIDWSRKGFTHHWLLDEKDNHGFKDLFEWKSVPELEEDESPSGFTFGVRENGTPVFVEYRSEEEPRNVGFADIAENIMSLDRIKKVEEGGAHLLILHGDGEVSGYCFNNEIMGEIKQWRGIADIRILSGCVAGLTRDGRTLIAPKKMGEDYYDGYQKLKDIPFDHLRKDSTGFHSPIPDWVDFRKAVQLDYLSCDSCDASYRALMEDGTILVALFNPGFATKITPSFPVERLVFFGQSDFAALSKEGRAAMVAWQQDWKKKRLFLRFIELRGKETGVKVVVDHTSYSDSAYFLTPGGKLYEWERSELKFKFKRGDLLDCGSNSLDHTRNPYFGTLTRNGRLKLETTHKAVFDPCETDDVKKAVFARNHVIYLKNDGTVGFMGKPRSCCKGLDRYRDVVDVEGTDSTTTLRMADGSSVTLTSRTIERTPPPAR